MKVISWNINSIRKRANLVETLLEEHRPDFLCLQETKCQNDQFPKEFFYNIGYHVACHGQKAYNGVAIITPKESDVVQTEFAGIEDARFISVKSKIWHVCSVYVPNGQMVNSPAYHKQISFMEAIKEYKVKYHADDIVIAGDFNIAPKDVHADFALRSSFICDKVLREKWCNLLEDGLCDHFDDQYTWYDYRWPKMGARIDNILVGGHHKIVKAQVLNKYRHDVMSPSDHCPLLLEIED